MRFKPDSLEKWPNRAQKQLLRAALLGGNAGLEAWKQWRKENKIESIDTASFFILPQVYLNLKRFRAEVAELDRLKGVYRWTWSQNQLTLAGLVEVLRLLNANQISTVVLKGIPLALNYYRDLGARMMKDADLLVDVQDVARVIAILKDTPWRHEKLCPPDHLMPFFEALHFLHPKWNLVDIHWRPFCLDTPSDAEHKLREHAQHDSIGGVSVRVTSVTDLLLLICFHARRSDIHSACRWIVDSFVLMRESKDPIDWGRLLELSQQLGIMLPVRDALSYLHSEFDAPIPIATLDRAWKMSVQPIEKHRYRQMIQHGMRSSIRGVIDEHWTRYSDACRLYGWNAGIPRFLHYFLFHCRRELKTASFRALATRFLGGWFHPGKHRSLNRDEL
jgi:hypothetical protein